ncbi:hypothetical protein GPJ56_002464 [Histomonas meleagridis]|uniref:uncharacterized protein n=1 Tax=Histomonas meleagridis TaxID=135588 RepID=UPI00355A7B6C|nr:hypothetical protein GPJ56_002464 [Histomonas meleagridis]KAH0798251.1 hypothetical protein GO595_008939 [Histomonas meleagridis]
MEYNNSFSEKDQTSLNIPKSPLVDAQNELEENTSTFKLFQPSNNSSKNRKQKGKKEQINLPELPQIPYSIPKLELPNEYINTSLFDLDSISSNLDNNLKNLSEMCHDALQNLIKLEAKSKKCVHYSKLTKAISDSSLQEANQIYEIYDEHSFSSIIQNSVKEIFNLKS